MIRLLMLLGFLAFLTSCGEVETNEQGQNNTTTATDTTGTTKNNLIQVKGDLYVEYYPNGKSIRFQGTQDDAKLRHGKWAFFSESGQELSTTMYYHGKKHGHSIVKYPNGVIHYYGEYDNDVKIGIWKSYDEQGHLIEEKDFGTNKNKEE